MTWREAISVYGTGDHSRSAALLRFPWEFQRIFLEPKKIQDHAMQVKLIDVQECIFYSFFYSDHANGLDKNCSVRVRTNQGRLPRWNQTTTSGPTATFRGKFSLTYSYYCSILLAMNGELSNETSRYSVWESLALRVTHHYHRLHLDPISYALVH